MRRPPIASSGNRSDWNSTAMASGDRGEIDEKTHEENENEFENDQRKHIPRYLFRAKPA